MGKIWIKRWGPLGISRKWRLFRKYKFFPDYFKPELSERWAVIGPLAFRFGVSGRQGRSGTEAS